MTITNGYTTLPEMKGYVTVEDDEENAELELAIGSASRLIDDHCNRRFYLDASTSARTYLLAARSAPSVIDLCGNMWHDFDPATVPVVKSDDDGDGTFETTWTVTTDYQLEPLNHAEMEAEPQNQIRLCGSRFLRPAVFGRPQLQVTAKWGWPAIPISVKQACQIVARDIYKSKDAPFGIAGMSDVGPYRINENRTATALLTRYKLPKGLA